MMHSIRLLLALAVLFPAPSFAAMIRAEFAGTITESSWAPYAPPAGFEVGAPFSGFYEYDTEGFEAVDVSTPGRLVGLPARVGWTIGSVESSSPLGSTVAVYVFDDVPGDAFQVIGDEVFDSNIFFVLDSGTGTGFEPQFDDYGVVFGDRDGTVFDSLSFPGTLPLLSEFERAALVLNGYIEGPGVSPPSFFDVEGTITSLRFRAPIPEPTGALLFLTALLLVRARLRPGGTIPAHPFRRHVCRIPRR